MDILKFKRDQYDANNNNNDQCMFVSVLDSGTL